MTRVKGWMPDAYVPFRIMLDMEEESKSWGRALGTKGPCTSIVAGFVLKQRIEVHSESTCAAGDQSDAINVCCLHLIAAATQQVPRFVGRDR